MPSLRLSHTPGPWRCGALSAADNSLEILSGPVSPKHSRIASVYSQPFYAGNQQLYNARIIAAAPELLEAVALAANQAATLASRCSDPEERARFQADEAHFRALVSRAS